MQQLRVRWNSSPFKVSNGVRQGSVLSPILFSVYLDSLLVDLSKSGVGCYWGSFFAGAFAYADDVVLLAPCAAALRIMLSICSRFALSHKLASKTKLICFSSRLVRPHNDSTTFCYHTLRASLTLVIFSLKTWMTWMMTLKEF